MLWYHSFSGEWIVFRNPYYVTDSDPMGEEISDMDSGLLGTQLLFDEADVKVVGEDGKIYAAKAGTDIYVRKTYAKNFKLTHNVHKVGYIHSVSFTPLSSVYTDYPACLCSFAVVNTYIPNASTESSLGALQVLGNLNLGVTHTFAGGDWNIVVRPYDTTGNVSAPALVKALDSTMKKLTLTEVVSTAMTRISGECPPKLSRLDRWYTSFSEAERMLTEPDVWLPPHKYEPGLSKVAPSDHFPVLLNFNVGDSSKGVWRIPLWVVRDPKFAETVIAQWDDKRVYKNPCRKLVAFSKLMTSVAKAMTKSHTTGTTRWCDAVSLAVKVLRDLESGSMKPREAKSRCRKNSKLRDAILESPDKPLSEMLSDFITRGRIQDDDAYGGGYSRTGAVFSERVASYVPLSKTRADAHSRVRAAVPANRKGLDHLIDDEGDCICDGDRMAELLKRSWEPIWRGKAFDEEYVQHYLSSYTKRLKGDVPTITCEDVIAEIAHPRSSCPGPDGVPFAAYGVVCAVVAPIFLEVIKYCMAGGKLTDEFNDVLLFFLPKDGTFLPTHMRPIAASNTSNRIIANIIRRKLEPFIHALLEKNQAGFVRTSSIEDNIRFFNDRFYSALYSWCSPDYPAPGLEYCYKVKGKSVWWDCECNPDDPLPEQVKHYHILFLDFKKAFDSVNRRYLMYLLSLIGVPEGYINLVWALFQNVHAIPAVGKKTSVRIAMLDGLKQGCPLSPLFFILTIDVLLVHINRMPQVHPKCFADDLAVGFSNWRRIAPVLLAIDDWSAAAGLAPNVGKTKFISTQPAAGIGDFSRYLPHNWRGIELVGSYVYLGILIGAGIDVTMVYGAAMEKLLSRVARYLPFKSMFNTAERVRVANTYFVPILSYIHRFYMMTKYVQDQVEVVLRSWLIKNHETNLRRLCAPTHAAGLHCPLRDPVHVNTACVLRQRAAEPPGPRRHYGSYTLMMSDHVLKAAEAYEKVVGTRYPAGATQAQHYQTLLHADAKPLQQLGDTLLARFKRHDADPDRTPSGSPGTDLDSIVGNCLRIPNSLNAGLRNHAFYIVHNLLYVGARFKGDDADEKSRDCTFCGHQDETVAHVFCECVCTRSAMRLLLANADSSIRNLGSILVGAKADDFLLRSPDLPRAKLVTLLVFSHAVWRARWTASEGGLSQALIARLAAANFVSFYRHRFKWHIRDRQLEKDVFQAVLQSLPRDSIFVYTDGSSFGNPGPAGSGFAIFDGATEIGYGSFPLGIATNAYAEVHGVAKATEYLVKLDSDKHIYIFVDNRQAIALATGASDATWCQQEVGLTRRNLGALAARSRVSFFWVPGHAGVAGNERVDKLAKAGARGRSALVLSPSHTWTCTSSAASAPSPVGSVSASHSGPSRGPARPVAAATLSSAPSSLGCGLISPLSPPPSGEVFSDTAASAALSPAPSPAFFRYGQAPPLSPPPRRGVVSVEAAPTSSAPSPALDSSQVAGGVPSCPGSSGGPARSVAAATWSTAPSSLRCERVPPLPLPSSFAAPPSAPSPASCGQRGAGAVPSLAGSVPSVGSRDQVESESSWLSSPAARARPAAEITLSSNALPSPIAVNAAELPTATAQKGLPAPQSHSFFARFQGPAPPRKPPSTKTGQSTCSACMINLKNTRTNTNRRYATYKKKKLKKRLKNQLPAPVRPQHRYNTRSKRSRPEQRDTHLQNRLTIANPPADVTLGSSNKRIRLSHPPKGIDIPGVNFPT